MARKKEPAEPEVVLTREEIAAMWVYSVDDADPAGVREWWASRPAHRKTPIRDFLAQLDAAPDAPAKVPQ